jgi:hypothetical protein
MKSTTDLWEDLGSLTEEDVPLVLNKLFLIYETRISHNPDDEEAKTFFKNLDLAIGQTNECNLNRR